MPTIEEPVQISTNPNTSKAALDQFMKFDRKYATIKEPKRSELIVEETDESEPIIIDEKSTPSPRFPFYFLQLMQQKSRNHSNII